MPRPGSIYRFFARRFVVCPVFLLALGTAAQNGLVARMANQLPVQLRDGQFSCDDGFSIPADHCALALLHFDLSRRIG